MMASRRLCISAGHVYDARPVRPCGPGGGGGHNPCPGQGREGGGGWGACRGGGGAAPTCPVGARGLRTPRGYPRGGPMPASTGRRDVLHPCASQHRVEGLGLHPCTRQHRVEATVGVAPLQPTPTPLLIEGLWECCYSCTRAAAHIPLLVHQVCCCSFGSATALQPTPARLPPRGSGGAATAALKLPQPVSCRTTAHSRPVTNRGAEGGEGKRGGGGKGVGGVGGGGTST